MPTTLSTETTPGNNRQKAPLLESLRDIEFVCPICRGELARLERSFECGSCSKTFPTFGGIPDFRVFPDPFLSYDEDRERSSLVLDALEDHDLESLLTYYWSLSDITPTVLRDKFVRSAVLGESRAEQQLQSLDDGTFDTSNDSRLLEIGSGTGNLLSVAMQQGKQVVGVDIAMRWLHVSRRRFMDKGLPVPPLVCCCAERLPFRESSFEQCVISSTLEFVREPGEVLSECARTLGERGSVSIQTANRFSIAKDPYSYLWGVGFLPRRWQSSYVKWRCGATYENTRTLSYGEIKRLSSRYFGQAEFALPDIADEALRRFPWMTRLQVQIYRLLKRFPPTRAILQRIGPGWYVNLTVPRQVA